MQRNVISAEWVKSKHENLYGFLDDLLSDVIKLTVKPKWKRDTAEKVKVGQTTQATCDRKVKRV